MSGKFFNPDGTLIANKDDFIKFYGEAYYKSENKSVIPGLRRTDRCEEEKIDSLLKNGVKSKEDIIKILCWKTGGNQTDDYSVRNANYTITIDDQLVEFIINSSVATDDDAVKALKTIMETKNIGFTYAMTLLYFMSKGRYPIYDKFAHIALLVINSCNSFDCIIKDSELQGKGRGKNRKIEIPSRIDKNASDKDEKIKLAFDQYKKKYIERINTIFSMNYGEEQNYDRKVDRALWVYGHLFNDKQTNRDRMQR